MPDTAAQDRKSEIETRLQMGKKTGGSRILKWGGGAAVLAIGAWALMAMLSGGDGGVTYRTAAVQRGDLRITVTATGTVEPTNLVDVSSELSGTLKSVLVDFNDTVAQGQPLAELDTTKLEAALAVAKATVASAQAQVSSAETTLAETKEDYESTVALDERGVTSHSTLLSKRAAYYRAQSQLKVASANLDLAKAQMQEVEADLDKACICSPIAGVVLDREADKGQIVASSLSAPVLFTIAEDLAKMDVQVAVDEADIGKVTEGKSATFTVEAYDEREFPATIRSVRYASETVDGVVSYTAILSVQNDDLALRPGMTATAEILVTEVKDALSVPNAALRYAPPVVSEDEGGGSGLLGMIMPRPPSNETPRTDGKSVWVLKDGAPVEVPVTTGDSDGTRTQIVEGALAAGDLVITGQEG